MKNRLLEYDLKKIVLNNLMKMIVFHSKSAELSLHRRQQETHGLFPFLQ